MGRLCFCAISCRFDIDGLPTYQTRKTNGYTRYNEIGYEQLLGSGFCATAKQCDSTEKYGQCGAETIEGLGQIQSGGGFLGIAQQRNQRVGRSFEEGESCRHYK